MKFHAKEEISSANLATVKLVWFQFHDLHSRLLQTAWMHDQTIYIWPLPFFIIVLVALSQSRLDSNLAAVRQYTTTKIQRKIYFIFSLFSRFLCALSTRFSVQSDEPRLDSPWAISTYQPYSQLLIHDDDDDVVFACVLSLSSTFFTSSHHIETRQRLQNNEPERKTVCIKICVWCSHRRQWMKKKCKGKKTVRIGNMEWRGEFKMHMWIVKIRINIKLNWRRKS